MDLGDAWRQDERFDLLFGSGLPVPRGFRIYGGHSRAGWRYRVGDKLRNELSLSADGDDISALAEVPVNGLWRLECRYRRVTDDDFDLIARFDSLEELDLSHTKITDRATLRMHTLQKLRILRLGSCAITDAALEHLVALRSLEELDVCNSRVTAKGLPALAFHPALRIINLRDTPVTGAQLGALTTIPHLRELRLDGRQKHRTHDFAAQRPDVVIL
jgi:hypothetical protein